MWIFHKYLLGASKTKTFGDNNLKSGGKRYWILSATNIVEYIGERNVCTKFEESWPNITNSRVKIIRLKYMSFFQKHSKRVLMGTKIGVNFMVSGLDHVGHRDSSTFLSKFANNPLHMGSFAVVWSTFMIVGQPRLAICLITTVRRTDKVPNAYLVKTWPLCARSNIVYSSMRWDETIHCIKQGVRLFTA